MKFMKIVVFMGGVIFVVVCGEKSFINVIFFFDLVLIGVFVDSFVEGINYFFVFVENGIINV